MNTIKLIEISYKVAKEKGFWDDEVIIGEKLALINSELSEALEAHRKNRFAEISSFDNCFEIYPECFVSLFVDHIKDSFEDEIADVFIRLFDLAGYLGVIEVNQKSMYRLSNTRRNVPTDILFIQGIMDMYYSYNEDIIITTHFIEIIYSVLLDFCEKYEIKNIEKFIELKIEYNKTRGYKHGKRY